MAEDKSFKQLIEEQKKTNKLLMQQIASDAKGSDLGTSFKNSAGEIINDVLIGNKQKRESDETQAVIKKGNEDTKTITGKNQDKNFKIFTKMSEALTGAFVTKGKNGSSVKNEEKTKDLITMFKEIFGTYLGKNSWVGKQLSEIGGFFSKYFKKFKDTGKGILKVLFGVTVYGLVLQYLNSPGFKEFLKGDAPKKIAAAAKRIFGKGGLLSQLSLLIKGDGSVENKGLLGHLTDILGGFLGLTDKSGWRAIAEMLGLIDKTVSGKKTKDGKPDENDETSMFGRLSLLQKAFVVVAGALALKALLPGIVFKGGLLLLSVSLIGKAIERINDFLGLTAKTLLDQDMKDADGNPILQPSTMDKAVAGVQSALGASKPPLFNLGENKLLVPKAFPLKSGEAISKKGNLVKKINGVNTVNQITGNRANQFQKFQQGKGLSFPQKVFNMLPRLPDGLKKPLNWLLKKIPLTSQALALYQFGQIMNRTDIPAVGRPNQQSKTRELYRLAGMLGGATLGGMLGGGIGILGGGVGAIPGSILGMGFGGPIGNRLMDYVYRLSYFKNAGMDAKSMDSMILSDVGNNFKGLFGMDGQKNRKDTLIGGSNGPISKLFQKIAPFITPGASFIGDTSNTEDILRVNPDYTGNMTNEQFLETIQKDYPNLGGPNGLGGMNVTNINNINADKGLNPAADVIIRNATPAVQMAAKFGSPIVREIGAMGLINR